MPVVRCEDFGTDRAPDWATVRGGIVGMDCWRAGAGETVELHFHDCEEFWFVLEGEARVMDEGEEATVGPGDVVCTHMGDEHAVLEILKVPYSHVWVECNLRGKKRTGHLHRPEDG